MPISGELWKNEYTRNKLYTAIRSRVFRGTSIETWDLNGSLGIWSDETDDKAKSSYDMQQIMRYHYAYCRKPEGDITVDFREPLLQGSLPQITCSCQKEEEHYVEEVTMSSKNIQILDDALQVYGLCHRYAIRKLFSYYTDDRISLEIAAIAERLYEGIDPSKEYIKRIDDVRKKIVYSGAAYDNAM